MGWSVHVIPVVSFVAVCDEMFPPTGTPDADTAAVAAGTRCEWRGPDRGREADAQNDADAHRQEHADAWRALNAAWDRGAK